MRNTMIYRFDAYGPQGLSGIEQLENEGTISVKLHLAAFEDVVTFENAETVAHDFYFSRDFDEGEARVDRYGDFQHLLPEFHELIGRHYVERHGYKTLSCVRDLFADRNLFYRLVSFFLNRFEKHDIDLVMFDEVPHYGGSWLCYKIAQALGIQTVVFLQSIFREKVICVQSYEDIGDLSSGPNLSDRAMEFQPKLRKVASWYYDENQTCHVRERADFLFQEINAIWLANWKEFLEFAENHEQAKKLFRDYLFSKWMPNANKHLKKFRWRLEMAHRDNHNVVDFELRLFDKIANYLQAKEVLESYSETVTTDVDLNRRYVLFALHYQPELTTCPLGGAYSDQARAIEDLAAKLPDDVLIYVKDHRVSFGAMRSRDFYERLARIKNVVLVPIQLDTNRLLEKCEFVATITGTIGFEAICTGKPAVTFGHAWYHGLPGVFRFAETDDIAEIQAYQFDPSLFNARFSTLSRKLADVVPFWSIPDHLLPDDWNRAENEQRFVATVKQILNQHTPRLLQSA